MGILNMLLAVVDHELPIPGDMRWIKSVCRFQESIFKINGNS